MADSSKRLVRFGTRGSKLALAQTGQIIRQLQDCHPDVDFETVVIKTTGDRLSARYNEQLAAAESSGAAPGALPAGIPEGKGIFIAEIEQALLDQTIDAAVHSFKDLPTEEHNELRIAAVPPREDPRDVLVTKVEVRALSELPQNAIIATGSLRRSAQLCYRQPGLGCVDIRGNVDTRLRKLRENDAWHGTVLAAAGLNRLRAEVDLAGLFVLPFPADILPAPAQGALALQCRRSDDATADVLSVLDDAPTRAAITAERSLLAGLGGGCRQPIGAYARVEEDRFRLGAIAWLNDEPQPRRGTAKLLGANDSPAALGKRLASSLLDMS